MMRNGRRWGAFILLITVLAFGVIGNGQAAQKTGKVKGGWLILRSSPSFSGAQISSYPTGTIVTITGQYGSWYAVTAPDGMTGYMLGSYLTVSGTGMEDGTTAYVTSRNGKQVRLRSGPGTQYNVIAAYAPGTKCTILGSDGDFCKVQIGSYTGYMMATYLKADSSGSGGGGSSGSGSLPGGGGYSIWVVSGNGRGVNLRSGPSKSYGSMGVYPPGTKGLMISAGSTWSMIQIGNVTGYMMSTFISANEPSLPDPQIPVVGGAYVYSANGKYVNLRTGPGMENGAIRSFASGTPLTIITRGSEWYFVHIGQYYGYMMKQFIAEN